MVFSSTTVIASVLTRIIIVTLQLLSVSTKYKRRRPSELRHAKPNAIRIQINRNYGLTE